MQRGMRKAEEVGEVKIKSIRYAGKADVYNMEVDDTHDFIVQGGVVSHNCADEVRYFCMSRPIAPRVEVKKQPIFSDPLNQFGGGRYDDWRRL